MSAIFVSAPQSTLAKVQDVFCEAKRYFILKHVHKASDVFTSRAGYMSDQSVNLDQNLVDGKDELEFYRISDIHPFKPTYHAEPLHSEMTVLKKMLDELFTKQFGCSPPKSSLEVSHYWPRRGDSEFFLEEAPRNIVTLIQANAPGLECGDVTQDPTPVPCSLDGFVVVPGENYNAENDLKSQTYRVRRHKEWAYRQSVAYFVDLDTTQG